MDETNNVEASYISPISPTWIPESLPLSPSPTKTSPAVTIGSELSDSILHGTSWTGGSLPVEIVSPHEAPREIPRSDNPSRESAAAVGHSQYENSVLDVEEETPGFRMKIHDHNKALLIKHFTDNLACWVGIPPPHLNFDGLI